MSITTQGVFKEKAGIYRSFVRTNVAAVAATLVLALAWIIMSMVNHNKGKDTCVAQFVAVGSSTSANSGETICNIFTWVQVGLLAFLWIFIALAQAYFLTMVWRLDRLLEQGYSSVRSRNASTALNSDAITQSTTRSTRP
jgi:hypothetical protein